MEIFCVLIMVVSKLIQEFALNEYLLLYIKFAVTIWKKWGEILFYALKKELIELIFPQNSFNLKCQMTRILMM